MNKPVLVVMAAGMGSRYGGLKQLDPVGPHGQLIIDYTVYDARRAGFETVIFVIKPEMEARFRAGIGDRISQAMEVKYAYQTLDDLPDGYTVPEGRVKPWGTAHAALSVRHMVDGPFAVINADDCYGPQAFQAIYQYLSTTGDTPECYSYAMVGYRLENTVTENGSVARGVCTESEDHFLTQVIEFTNIEKGTTCPRATQDGGATWMDLPGDTVVSMNLWGFTRSYLDEALARFPRYLDDILAHNPLKGEVYLPAVVSQLIAEGKAKVKMLHSNDKWYGVTYHEDKPAVEAAIAQMTEQGLYPENLWA